MWLYTIFNKSLKIWINKHKNYGVKELSVYKGVFTAPATPLLKMAGVSYKQASHYVEGSTYYLKENGVVVKAKSYLTSAAHL
jgi:hypothetical protein